LSWLILLRLGFVDIIEQEIIKDFASFFKLFFDCIVLLDVFSELVICFDEDDLGVKLYQFIDVVDEEVTRK